MEFTGVLRNGINVGKIIFSVTRSEIVVHLLTDLCCTQIIKMNMIKKK